MGVPLKCAFSLLVIAPLLSTPAVARDPLQSSGCREALHSRYGEAFTFELINRRNTRQGLVLKVGVRDSSAASGNWRVRYATCRVARGGGQVTVAEEDGSAPQSPTSRRNGGNPD